MQEREGILPERLSNPVHVEVRWYRKDPNTDSSHHVLCKTAQLSSLQAVLIGTSYDTLDVFSAENAMSLQKELGTRQALDIVKGRYIGLAMVDDNAKLTMEIEGEEQQTAGLSEGNKTARVQLENSDTLLIGVIGINPGDVANEFDTLFSRDTSKS